MRRRTSIVVIAALAAAVAATSTCSDTSGPQTILIVVESDQPAYAPGDLATGTISVDPRGRMLDWVGVAATGYLAVRESVAVDADTAVALGYFYQLPSTPASGTLVLHAFARSAASYDTSAALMVTVADTTPPALTAVAIQPAAPQPNRPVWGRFSATDNAGLVRVVVSFSGAVTGADTLHLPLTVAGYPRLYTDSASVHVPRGRSPGATVTATITATDLAGLSTTQTVGPIALTDTIAPLIGATTNAPTDITNPFLPGDTLRITVNGGDNHEVAYLGFIIGAPASVRDSAAVGDTAGSVPFVREIPPTWVGNQSLTAFARDSVGNLAEFAPGPSMFVLDAVRRPVRTGPTVTAVRDLVVDEVRNAVYITVPGSQQIEVLSLTSMTFGTPIATPFEPGGLDLATDGDTLVVALRHSPYLGLVDLTQASLTVDTVRITFDAGDGRGPDQVRVAENNFAIVTIASDSPNTAGSLGRVVAYRFSTGTSAVRLDAGSFGAVSSRPALVRSVDGRQVFLFYNNTCCTAVGQVYSAQDDTFGLAVSVPWLEHYHLSADSTGAAVLVDRTVLDVNLAIAGNVSPPLGFGGGVAALAPSGTVGYFGQDIGTVPTTYTALQVPSGTRIERVLLPGGGVPPGPARLWVLPDGQWMLGLVGGRFVLVDLR